MTYKMVSNILAIISLLVAIAATLVPTLAYSETLVVTVNGLRSTDGVVHVLLYDNDRSFQENSINDLVAYTTEKVNSNTMKVSLSSIKPGTYALMLHHDENSNNAFDMNGELPIEGWGYSNNAGAVEMPKFSAASFKFDANSKMQEIKIIYAN